MSTAPSLTLVPAPAERWISRQRFLEFSGRTLQWLSEQVRNGNVKTRETSRKLANGRFEVEFAVSSLPPKARALYEANPAREPALQLAPSSQQALSLFAPVPVAPAAPRKPLDAHSERQMLDRLNLLQPILDYADNPARYRALKLQDGSSVRSKSDMVRFVAESSGTSAPTLWRMLKRHAEGGEGALLKRPRKDANQSRWFAEHRDAACLVASLYLGDGFVPGASIKACERALQEQCGLLGLVPADLPDYATVRRFLLSAPAPLKTLAREGRKKFGELHLPYITRAYTEAANSIWVSDHMIADIECLNDCFTDLPYGQPMRMRLTAILDYRSRYVVAHTWCVEGSSVSLGAAITQAVRRHGPCDLFYCDNGKDYIKVAKGAAPGYLQQDSREAWWEQELDRNAGVLARLGIRVNHCIPHHPQSKHVERFFRTVHATFCAVWHTYTAGQPSLRPDSTAALMAIHRRLLKRGEVEQSMHPTATQVMSLFEVWLDMYHGTVHSGKGMDGRSPAEVFAAERNPQQRPTPPQEQLLLATMEHDTRLVREVAIHLFDTRYIPADDVASARLFALNGREVHIAYDRLDPEYIAVLDSKGYVLCTLRVEQQLRMAPDDPQTQAQIAASMQQRGMLLRETRNLHDSITRGRRALGAKAPLELLASKALPADTSERVTQRAQKPQRLRKVAEEAARPQPLHSAGIASKFLNRMKGGK